MEVIWTHVVIAELCKALSTHALTFEAKEYVKDCGYSRFDVWVFLQKSRAVFVCHQCVKKALDRNDGDLKLG